MRRYEPIDVLLDYDYGDPFWSMVVRKGAHFGMVSNSDAIHQGIELHVRLQTKDGIIQAILEEDLQARRDQRRS